MGQVLFAKRHCNFGADNDSIAPRKLFDVQVYQGKKKYDFLEGVENLRLKVKAFRSDATTLVLS